MLKILLADDDAIDRELFIEGLQHSKKEYSVTEVANGEELLKHLDTAGLAPDLIILDLNMPVKDGRETLKELKENAKHKHIPVFILSTSNARFDVTLSYQLGANLFLVKPHNFKALVELQGCLFTLFEKYASFENN